MQYWYETNTTKTGWDKYEWEFIDDHFLMENDWKVVSIIQSDKYGHPTLAIAEREVEV